MFIMSQEQQLIDCAIANGLVVTSYQTSKIYDNINKVVFCDYDIYCEYHGLLKEKKLKFKDPIFLAGWSYEDNITKIKLSITKVRR